MAGSKLLTKLVGSFATCPVIEGVDSPVHLIDRAAVEVSGTAGALYPVYVHSAAYVALHQGAKAAAEFQKILYYP